MWKPDAVGKFGWTKIRIFPHEHTIYTASVSTVFPNQQTLWGQKKNVFSTTAAYIRACKFLLCKTLLYVEKLFNASNYFPNDDILLLFCYSQCHFGDLCRITPYVTSFFPWATCTPGAVPSGYGNFLFRSLSWHLSFVMKKQKVVCSSQAENEIRQKTWTADNSRKEKGLKNKKETTKQRSVRKAKAE